MSFVTHESSLYSRPHHASSFCLKSSFFSYTLRYNIQRLNEMVVPSLFEIPNCCGRNIQFLGKQANHHRILWLVPYFEICTQKSQTLVQTDCVGGTIIKPVARLADDWFRMNKEMLQQVDQISVVYSSLSLHSKKHYFRCTAYWNHTLGILLKFFLKFNGTRKQRSPWVRPISRHWR
jgi:hypothetical protein